MINLYKYGEVQNSEIFSRASDSFNVENIVADIISQVKSRGDEAIFEYCEKFDKVKLDSLEVSEEEIAQAFKATGEQLIKIMEEAASNIREFHEKQLRNSFIISERQGVIMGQKVTAVEKAGIYVPGGTAAYPSSVLMNAIPAKIAGVGEIIMVTPPSADSKVNPDILTAAKIAGVDRIFKIGGAQAIAALAYGTKSVPKVDKITGPGNAFVAEAKRQVFGLVSIDMIAGPSEILVVADSTCSAKVVAADMLSQAEHDKNASAVLVTDSIALANEVSVELEAQLETLPRKEIARASIDNNGKIIVAENLNVAIDIANEIAPEHLEICVDNPFEYLDKIKHAGSIFMGKNCPEALGDYFAGPNHVLPTGGTARFSSPLSVDDFVKKTQFTYFSEDALKEVGEKVAVFAEREGLSAHARSATVRFK